MVFMFERLFVYKKASEFVVGIYGICSEISHKEIKDQIKRAALSISLNIAEGNGRIHIKERKQYFYTARGSLLECAAILGLLMDIDMDNRTKYEKLYHIACEIGKMLSGLIKSVGD
jgi:four helix bundle protein